MTVGSTPLDDFLSGAGSSTSTGETIQRVGVLLGAAGVIVAVGLLAFVGVVWRGRAADRFLLLRLAAAAGAIAAVGGVIEVAGVASILDIGWDAALADRLGRVGMMRLIGGALVTVGLVDSLGRDRSGVDGACTSNRRRSSRSRVPRSPCCRSVSTATPSPRAPACSTPWSTPCI